MRPIQTAAKLALGVASAVSERLGDDPVTDERIGLTLVPGLDQQPLRGVAGAGRCPIDCSLSLPPLGKDIVWTTAPIRACFRRLVYNPWNQVQSLRRIPKRVSIPTKVDALSLSHKFVKPIQPAKAGLPRCDAVG